MPMVVETPNNPKPCPLFSAGIISPAIVELEVVVSPQAIPWANLKNKMIITVDANI